MKVTDIAVIPEYKLKVTFDDGVSGVIDLRDFIENGIFSVLKDKQLFNKVYTVGYAIAWSDELEIDAIAVYAEILNKKPEDILSPELNYAAN
jgi:hypothetical protein